MSNKRKAKVLVDSDEVGCGGTLSEKHTISCRFGDFANLPYKRGEETYSRVLKCHGHEWKILLCPGGDNKSDKTSVHVSVRLSLVSNITDNLRVKFCIRAGPMENEGVGNFLNRNDAWGGSDSFLRATALDQTNGFLDDEGALAVEVDVQIFIKELPVWRPKKQLLRHDMLKLLNSAEDADLTFVVRGTEFHAHNVILKTRAPMLASIAEGADGADVNISNVGPFVFRRLLRYIYGDEMPSSFAIRRNARALLEASDRFGCSGMKLHVESEVVCSVLEASNAADWILFADSHSCALLKEAAIAVFASNSKTVMESSGWEALKESAELMNELMQATFVRNSAAEGEIDTKTMSVTTLREQLEERGLDVDGTREMLIERLEEAKTNNET